MRLRLCSVWLVGACVFGTLLFEGRAQNSDGSSRKRDSANAKAKKKERQIDSGIFVDSPKVYDDLQLTKLLQNAEAGLAQLSPFISTTLGNAAFNAIQGANLNQTVANVQVLSPGSNQNSSPPSGVQSLTPPTSPASLSPADLLNQEAQLSSLISSLGLLQQGALSDQTEPHSSLPKTRVTLGFPIDIHVPPGYQYRNAVAEVEISVCAPESNAGKRPSLVALLPQSKTYNVASLVSKSSQIGGGAVAKIFSVTGGLFHSTQNYYLVQDQDTIAFQRQPEGQCSSIKFDENGGGYQPTSYSPLVFGWQFKPVLGQPVVQDGLRQTFVQLAFSPSIASSANENFEDNLSCETKTVRVRTRWRRYDPKTGRVGAIISEFPRPTEEPPSHTPTYSSTPVPYQVYFEDNGDSTLTVRAFGSFKAGTYVRIGSLMLNPIPILPGSLPNVSPMSLASNPLNSPQPAANNQTPPPSGSTGATGATGSTGATGASGATGATGASGASQSPAPANAPNSAQSQAATQLQAIAYVTQNYIEFTASSNLIALYGAKLVSLDGKEGPIVQGYPLGVPITCSLRIAEYLKSIAPSVPSSTPGSTAGGANGLTGLRAVTAPASGGAGSGAVGGPSAAEPGGSPGQQSPSGSAGTIRSTGTTGAIGTQTKPGMEYFFAATPPSSDAIEEAVSRLPVCYPGEPATKPTLIPFSDQLTLVKLQCLPLQPEVTARGAPPHLPVVLIDNMVFGLHDQPFAYPPRFMGDPKDGTKIFYPAGEVEFFAPNALLAKPGRQIIFKYLFESMAPAIYKIPPIPPGDISRCSLSPSTFYLAETGAGDSGKDNLYTIAGQNLDALDVLAPKPKAGSGATSPPTLYKLYLDGDVAKATQYVVFQCGTDAPITLALPQPASTSGAASAATPLPDKKITISAGETAIKITGKNLDKVVKVFYGGRSLEFALDPDSPSAASGASHIEISGIDDSNSELIGEITRNPGPNVLTKTIFLLGSDNNYYPAVVSILPTPPK